MKLTRLPCPLKDHTYRPLNDDTCRFYWLEPLTSAMVTEQYNVWTLLLVDITSVRICQYVIRQVVLIEVTPSRVSYDDTVGTLVLWVVTTPAFSQSVNSVLALSCTMPAFRITTLYGPVVIAVEEDAIIACMFHCLVYKFMYIPVRFLNTNSTVLNNTIKRR